MTSKKIKERLRQAKLEKELALFSEIPTEEDWDNWRLEDWPEYFCASEFLFTKERFFGKSREEMVPFFLDSGSSVGEYLYYMPPIPFDYYVFAYEVLTEAHRNFERTDASATASGLFCMADLRLTHCPAAILPVMEKLMPTLEYVAENQERYNANVEIYGSFQERLEKIKAQYLKLL